jgi:hypothetical protein
MELDDEDVSNCFVESKNRVVLFSWRRDLRVDTHISAAKKNCVIRAEAFFALMQGWTERRQPC